MWYGKDDDDCMPDTPMTCSHVGEDHGPGFLRNGEKNPHYGPCNPHILNDHHCAFCELVTDDLVNDPYWDRTNHWMGEGGQPHALPGAIEDFRKLKRHMITATYSDGTTDDHRQMAEDREDAFRRFLANRDKRYEKDGPMCVGISVVVS